MCVFDFSVYHVVKGLHFRAQIVTLIFNLVQSSLSFMFCLHILSSCTTITARLIVALMSSAFSGETSLVHLKD